MRIDIINALAEAYSLQHTSSHDEVLEKIYQDTLTNHAQSHMISGPVQGKLLEFLSTMIKPKYILEIGTFTGYSALCLAKGLQQDGELHTIELRKEDADLAQRNINMSPLAKKIHVHNSNALEIIPHLPYKWDMVFIDADKISYIAYYSAVLKRLSDDGWIIADNTFFHGEVLQQNPEGKNAKAIAEFNRFVNEDSSTEQVLIPVRDGITLIKKRTQ